MFVFMHTQVFFENEPRRDKSNKVTVRLAKTHISLGISQSDQTLRCPHEKTLEPYVHVPIERIAKNLFRLGWCPEWSESSLGAQSFDWFCHVAAQICAARNLPVA